MVLMVGSGNHWRVTRYRRAWLIQRRYWDRWEPMGLYHVHAEAMRAADRLARHA